ncbi:MAG TPA: glycosyltransferase family 39 protein, partial [Phycisphaerales bacterium]|nr:glycosyltransferase family 39 protein [Phycisphaerales bacterium]
MGGIALVVLCCGLYLPGVWSIPPVDRDESRFAQASAQMLASGTVEGWVVPRIQEKPRLNKPPLIYWLQATSAGGFGVEKDMHRGDAESAEKKRELISKATTGGTAGDEAGPLPTAGIWAYRLPSVVCAIVAVLLTWRIGVRMFDPRAAWLGAALLGACVMELWDARQARADQLLLATTTATMLALWNLWDSRNKENRGGASRAALFWLVLALGVMSKGPITPMIAALTAVCLGVTTGEWGWLKRMRPLIGLLIVVAVVGPWVFLVAREVGFSRYFSIVIDETVGRSAVAKEGHWGPPGYHAVMLAVMFWPGSLLAAAAVGRAWKKARAFTAEAQRTQRQKSGKEEFNSGRADARGGLGHRLRVALRMNSARPETFLLCWIVPSWIVFEIVGTKLPHYTLPLYPAIALLTGRAIFAADAGRLPGARGLGAKLGLGIWLAIGAAIGIVGPLIAWWNDWIEPPINQQAIVMASMFALLMLVCVSNLLGRRPGGAHERGRFVAAHLSAIGATVVASALAFGSLLPVASPLWITSRLMRDIEHIDPFGERPIAAIGYSE